MKKLNNFIMIPKEWREEYYLKGKINLHELLVLMWLSFLTNPVNGSAIISYAQLEQEFRGKPTKEYLRKIISNLRFHNLLWFEDRRGHRGSFQVWVKDYVRSSRYINNLEEIKIHNSTKHQEATTDHLSSQPDTDLSDTFHNLFRQKDEVKTEEMSALQMPSFTPPHTDTDTYTKNDTESLREILSKKSSSLEATRKDLQRRGLLKI